jgi:hypothetical protein
LHLAIILLRSKLAAVRRRYAAVAFASALAAIAGALSIALGIGLLLDWWLELSAGWRAALLLAYLAVALSIFVALVFIPLVIRRPDEEQLALWVERDMPSFRSRLISTVQLSLASASAGGGVAAGSPTMLRALLLETESLAAPIDFTKVVKTDRLMTITVVATLAVAAMITCGVYAGRTGWALLERAALVNGVAIPRRTQIDCQSKDITIARGETVTLAATARGRIPSEGTVTVQYDPPAGAELVRFPLPPVAGARGQFSRTIENVNDSFAYQILLGDNHTDTYHVTAVSRPAVLSLECVEVLPSYTHRPPQPRPPGDLSLLAGSRLRVAVRASKALATTGNHLHFHGSEIDVPLAIDSPHDPTRLGQPAGQDAITIPPGTTGMSIDLIDPLGIRSKDPVVYPIHLEPDRPPAVQITYPTQKETTVTAMAHPNIGIEAADDFAIGKLAITYRLMSATLQQQPDAPSAPSPTASGNIDLDLQGQTPAQLKRRFVWDLPKLPTGAPAIGDVIEFWAVATDTNDATGPGVGQSEHLRFRVVSNADKRAELLNSLGNYLGQINEVSETERDLNAKLGTIISAPTQEQGHGSNDKKSN